MKKLLESEVRHPSTFHWHWTDSEMILLSNEGEDLVGTPYIPLFFPLNPSKRDSQVEASESANLETDDYVGNALRVLPASYVTADSGTGLVHCAPAHGVDDYNA